VTGYSGWSYAPFRPFDCGHARPAIVRLAPARGRVELEWLGGGPAEIYWAESGGGNRRSKAVLPGAVIIDGLKDQTDYELYIVDGNGLQSGTRLLRTGEPVGTVVNYYHPKDKSHEFSGQYLGSPSLLRLPDGALLASMDYFCADGGSNLTQIFRSEDGGASWRYLTDLYPCFWGKLFLYRGILYMLGISTEYGDLLIGKSGDGGRNWGTPSVIARGGRANAGPGFHRAPTNPIIHGGRLWFSAEFGAWRRGYHASLTLSAGEDTDLLDPGNWILNRPVRVDPSWPGVDGQRCHIIEGNLVTAPGGGLVNMLRHAVNKAVMLRVDSENPAAPQRFEQVVDFPLGDVKFEIAQKDGTYYAVGNTPPARNVLALFESTDLLSWRHCRDIVNHSEMDGREAGFQYPSCLFEGGGLLVLSRTAWNGAANYHDSNMMTLHKVEDFLV